jgi:hypothetical protein
LLIQAGGVNSPMAAHWRGVRCGCADWDSLVAADTAFRLGDWDAADTAALEAIRVAGEVGQPAIVGWVLTIRVRILAAQGRHEEARAAAQAGLRIAEADRISAGLRYIHAAAGARRRRGLMTPP